MADFAPFIRLQINVGDVEDPSFIITQLNTALFFDNRICKVRNDDEINLAIAGSFHSTLSKSLLSHKGLILILKGQYLCINCESPKLVRVHGVNILSIGGRLTNVLTS